MERRVLFVGVPDLDGPETEAVLSLKAVRNFQSVFTITVGTLVLPDCISPYLKVCVRNYKALEGFPEIPPYETIQKHWAKAEKETEVLRYNTGVDAVTIRKQTFNLLKMIGHE